MWSPDFDPEKTVRLEDGTLTSSAALCEMLKEKKETVRTAFGDYKKRGKAAKPKGSATTLVRPIEVKNNFE